MFCTCEKSHQLWQDLKIWLENTLRINIVWDQKTIILGYMLRDKKANPINTVILITKSYLFWCSRKNKDPNILELLSRIKSCIFEQQESAAIPNKKEQFLKTWENWITIFNNE